MVQTREEEKIHGSRGVIAQRILEYILAQQPHLREGDALPSQAQLCQQLHVSPGLLREALSILETRGVIAIYPGRGGGIRVRQPSLAVMARDLALLLRWNGSTLREMVQARLAIEAACLRIMAHELRPDVLAALEEACGDDFHHELVASVNNTVLLHMFESLRQALNDMLGKRRCMNRAERQDRILAHRMICVALSEGRLELAERRLRTHLEAYLQYLQKEPTPEELTEV